MPCDRLEFDEIWTYLFKKQKRVRSTDPTAFGDQYVFVAIDPVTKLVPSFKVGKRTPETTWQFVADVKARIIGSPRSWSFARELAPRLGQSDVVYCLDAEM